MNQKSTNREIINKKEFDVYKVHKLIEGFNPFYLKIKEEEITNTPNYNLFKILNIKHLEVAVHTPFLANLLNPEETHAQGIYFLRILFNDILKLNNEQFTINNLEYLYIKEEHPFENGKIDILIYYNHPVHEKKFVVIIENKIYSGDQESQIERYYNYCKSGDQLDLELNQIRILYLTLNGREPEKKSISSKLKMKLYEDDVLRNISYSKEIKEWLTKSIEKGVIKSEKLNQSIKQYLEIICELSNQEDESRYI